jgi:pilus assembly protein Flp/PilA
MQKLITKVRRFLIDEDGPTAVEYAVLCGLLVVSILPVIWGLSSSMSSTYSSVSAALSTVNSGS